ncbi:hypothetical protein FRY77_09135 [Halomonas sp. MG34]|nr:hypothetical protein [Halomonas sp. MG34]
MPTVTHTSRCHSLPWATTINVPVIAVTPRSIGRTPLSVQRHGSRRAKHSAHGDEADPIGGSLKTLWKQAS